MTVSLYSWDEWGRLLTRTVFDEGSLKNAQTKAQHVVDSLMADMLGKTFTKKKIRVVQAHDDIFRRVSQVSLTSCTISPLLTHHQGLYYWCPKKICSHNEGLHRRCDSSCQALLIKQHPECWGDASHEATIIWRHATISSCWVCSWHQITWWGIPGSCDPNTGASWCRFCPLVSPLQDFSEISDWHTYQIKWYLILSERRSKYNFNTNNSILTTIEWRLPL